MSRTAVAALLALVAGASVSAATPMRASMLERACAAYREDPLSERGRACRTYLVGFIEGAAAADPRVLERDDAAESSWLKRAARTRLGSRIHRSSLLRPPEFCLSRPLPIDEIAERVVEYLAEQDPSEDRFAHEVVRTLLRRDFRCEASV